MIKEIIKGKIVLNFSILEHGFCSIPLSDGYTLSIEDLCRFIGHNGDFFSSKDHGHMFGLSEPYDAELMIRNCILGKEIQEVHLSKDTGDLTLVFDCGRVEIICSSAGYECYQINGPDSLTIVVHGGNN